MTNDEDVDLMLFLGRGCCCGGAGRLPPRNLDEANDWERSVLCGGGEARELVAASELAEGSSDAEEEREAS